MKAFSIRRNKQSAPDSATLAAEDPMSTSQRSIYSSVLSTSRPRNRLHKPNRSLDETHDPSGQVPNGDVIKRPQRKLVKRFRQHQRSDSSPEEGGSVTPPEQKPQSNSLPATLGRHSMDQPAQGWSESELILPSRGRGPLASRRHSVGSSADVLLTPIRGSTAISDDFVFLPAGPVVETDEIVTSPDSERPESPDPTIATLVTESETHHEVQHERGEKDNHPDTTIQTPGVTANASGSEHEGSTASQSRSSLAETQTLKDTAPPLHINVTPASPIEAVAVIPPSNDHPPPVVNVIRPPMTKGTSSQLRPTLNNRTSSSKRKETHNLVPFPTESIPEPGPWHSTLKRSEADHEALIDTTEPSLALWATSFWRTLVGIMRLAMECVLWLARKGLRNDLRSWMSYWFLRELTVVLGIPLLITTIALWGFYTMVHPHYDLSPMPARRL